MSKYKTVLFDWEGVVGPADKPVSFGWLTNRLEQDFNIPRSTAEPALCAEVGDFAIGAISNREFWQHVGKSLGVTFSEEFQDTIWADWPGAKALPEMRDLITYVKQKGLKAIVLSNILPTSAEQIRLHGGYALFDAEVLSCIEGVRKADPGIYQRALELADCLPEECIFIDDQERYLEPARALGITTILATSPEQVIYDVKQLLNNA